MGEEETYDIAPDTNPTIPRPPSSSRPTPPSPEAPNVLNYQRQNLKVARTEKIAWDDPWEGNKAKNLYFPLVLIVASIAFNFLFQTYFMQQKGAAGAFLFQTYFLRQKGTAGVSEASREMTLSLVIQVPTMLLACWVAVHWLDVAFGPLWPALLKLSSIALAPDALWSLAMLVGALLGHSGGTSGTLVGAAIGWIIGWAVGLALYFGLFVFFFALEMSDALKLTFLIWVCRVFVARVILDIVQNYLS